MRSGFTCSALIEAEDAVVGRIEPASLFGPDSSTRPTVQADDRIAVGVAAPFVEDGVTIIDGQTTGLERFDGRVGLTKGVLVADERTCGVAVVDDVGCVKPELGFVGCLGRHLGCFQSRDRGQKSVSG